MSTTLTDTSLQEHERRVVAAYAARRRLAFNPTERSRFLNIGYWRGHPQSLDEAAEAMTRLVGDAAELSQDDAVLDVGCGYGDAAMLWVEEFGPRCITGIDINPEQIKLGGQRLVARGLAERVTLQVGSAVHMPFGDAAFDKVLCVEAAHHFMTREQFFRESYRVLRPGGRLVLADVVPLPGKRFQPFFNPHNLYPGDEYGRKLQDAGFSDVSLSSIREHVFRPYSRFLRSRLAFRDFRGWMDVCLHRVVSARLDYLLVSATKA